MPTLLEDGGVPRHEVTPPPRHPTSLTQVDICEALCGDGVGRVFVNVLQAQAGKLWFIKKPGLQGTVRHHQAPRQDPTRIPWFKTCHKFQVSEPAKCQPQGPVRFSPSSETGLGSGE